MANRIRINAGGRAFETTRDTLITSGSGFFAALFGPTGSALRNMESSAVAAASSPGAKRPRSSDESSADRPSSENAAAVDASTGEHREIFVDRDPNLFADVLAFMRSTRLPARALRDADRLLDLKMEAEYFAYDALSAACDDARKRLRAALAEALRPEPEPDPRAESRIAVLRGKEEIEGGSELEIEIDVPRGKVLYLVSATLAGPCCVNRYERSKEDKEIPGCFINCDEDDTGDFQLLMDRDGMQNYVLAHVGLNQVHTSSESGTNVDFRLPLGICLDGGEDENVALRGTGSAEWHVLYWMGDAEAIPGLRNGGDRHARKRRTVISASSGSNGNSEMLQTLALQNMMSMGMLASGMLG